MNKLFDRCTGLCMGLGEAPVEISHLALSKFHPGLSTHSLGADATATGMQQGCVAFSLDHLVYEMGLPVPNHLKIDVDGLEPAIIRGASRLLHDDRLRSAMVECNPGPETYGIRPV